jgi:hypothetical protein
MSHGITTPRKFGQEFKDEILLIILEIIPGSSSSIPVTPETVREKP